MAKQGRAKLTSSPPCSVTAERAARLYRLLKLLGSGPQTRSQLLKRLRMEVRGFYRDLKLLRAAGIEVPLRQGRYCLAQSEKNALACLPFPDPCLSLGDAVQLSKGRTQAHVRLKALIAIIVG